MLPHWSVRRKTGPSLIPATSSQRFNVTTGRPMMTTRAAHADRKAGEGRGSRMRRLCRHRVLVG